MALGKPDIVSDAKPLNRIVTTEKYGLVYTDNEIDSHAETIKAIMNEELRERLGKMANAL